MSSPEFIPVSDDAIVEQWIHNMSLKELEHTRREVIWGMDKRIEQCDSFYTDVTEKNKETFKQEFANYLEHNYDGYVDGRMNKHDEQIKSLEKQLERAQEIIQKLASDYTDLKNRVDFRQSVQDFIIEDNKHINTKIEDVRKRTLNLEHEVL